MGASRAVACAVVLALAGCVAPTPRQAPAPVEPAATRTRTVLRQGGFLEIRLDVPVAPVGPKPAVVSYVEELRTPLLDAGFVVVSYALHWEYLRGFAKPPAPGPPSTTVGKWMLASPSADVIGQGYLGLVDGNARNTVPEVLDAAAADPDVDARRLGIVGFSTNGFTALQAAGWNPRLRAVVAIAACGDYHRFLHESTLAMNGEPLALAPDYDRWLRDVEPVRHALRFVDTALLMVNGSHDLPIPIACARSTARAIRRAHALVGDPARFRFVVIDEGHVMGERARGETLGWLRRWLGG
jgi:hypothetical protein